MTRTIFLLTVMGAAMLLASGPAGWAQSAASTSEALFTISHGANRDIATASTFTAGTFKIKNNSKNGQKIKKLRVDASSAVLPDLVFDPKGTAGDDVGKCFTADSGTSAVGLVAPADPCSDPFSDPLDGGYRVLTIDFSDFGPGETFTFSLDSDPTSINGANDPGPNRSGSVSGLELTGAEATVEFDDGSVRTGEPYRIPGSPHSSQNTLKANAPPKPGIEVLGVTAPAKVSKADQTVRVSGPAGSSVSLMDLEAGLFTEGVPNGGHDLDPYEANSALAVSEKSAQIGSTGYVDVPVTLTRTDTVYGGLNHLVAVIKDSTGRSGPNSDTLVFELQDSNTCTVKGTNGDDTLIGTEGDDVICGFGGKDTIEGLGGNDKLFGGDGGDQLLGGRGDDTIDGGLGTGKDVADYSDSPAPVIASLTNDTATGDGTDTLANIESLAGSLYADQLTGND
jgi:Ca2+-binding RTX toxin-like protein